MTLIDARGTRAAVVSLCVVFLVACVAPSLTPSAVRNTYTPGGPRHTPLPTLAQQTPSSSPTNAPPQATSTSLLSPTSSVSPTLETLEWRMFEAVNRARGNYDLPPYRLDEALATVARAHAQDMVARGYWSHVTPEGKTYRDRLVEHGLDPSWAGENYYYSFFPAEEIVEVTLDWFMDDPPHRDNILHEHCTRIGVGIVEDSQGAFTLVLVFAGY